ncbi:MAG: hypothetical protein U0T36_05745 [Saprospiraceae bacterium]
MVVTTVNEYDFSDTTSIFSSKVTPYSPNKFICYSTGLARTDDLTILINNIKSALISSAGVQSTADGKRSYFITKALNVSKTTVATGQRITGGHHCPSP